MRTRRVLAGLTLGLTMGVAACDGSVKWPGFDTPEPAPSDTAEVNVPAAPDTGTVPTEVTIDTPDVETPDIDTPIDTGPVEDTPDTGNTLDTPVDETAPNGTPIETPEIDATTPPDPTETEPEDTEPEDTSTDPVAEDPTPEDIPEEVPPAPPAPVVDPAFSYHAPGTLLAGSGTGSPDRTVFAPDMVFPILTAAAYPQSMVWNFGGGIGGGDECDARNYEYPWRDNFCEKRTRDNGTPSCPVSRVHLGQDIRVGDAAGCNAMRNEYRNNPQGIARYRVVAAEDGVISNIGRYTVSLRSGPRIYRYLHMNMRALQVSLGDTISAGQHLGYISKDFGGTPTTFHLHFEIKVNTPDGGWEYVPPYTSLVESYARREQAPGEEIPRTVGVASVGLPIPEGFIITE